MILSHCTKRLCQFSTLIITPPKTPNFTVDKYAAREHVCGLARLALALALALCLRLRLRLHLRLRLLLILLLLLLLLLRARSGF